MSDPTGQLIANNGMTARVITGSDTVWEPKGFAKTNISATDNTHNHGPVGTTGDFGSYDNFRFRKRGGRVFNVHLNFRLTPGVFTAGTTGCYVDDIAQNILENVRIEYASKTIQEYRGEFLKAYNRLMYNDITREHYNARNLAGVPPGSAAELTARGAAVTAGVELHPHLSWFFFTRSEDYALTPEALSSEMILRVDYRRLEQCVYARTAGVAVVGDAFTAGNRPRITAATCYTQLIHLPGPEKSAHLKRFTSGQGVVYKILDVEQQLSVPVTNAAQVISIKLDNFRLESQFILFFLRSARINNNWDIDRMQSTVDASLIVGAGNVSALRPLTSFRLIANGKAIVDPCTDLQNRAVWRDHYFPGSNVSEFIYFIPFAHMLRDHRNVVSYQNLANLGSLELELTLPASADARLFDAYDVCHNIVQQKMGDIIRIVH